MILANGIHSKNVDLYKIFYGDLDIVYKNQSSQWRLDLPESSI